MGADRRTPGLESAMSSGPWSAIYCKLFDDVDFQRLSPHARLLLLTLRLCPQARPAAIFRYYREVLASQSGLSQAELDAAFRELEKPSNDHEPWIYRDELVVWVRNGLRNDPSIVMARDTHRRGVERAVDALPRTSLIAAKFRHYYG